MPISHRTKHFDDQCLFYCFITTVSTFRRSLFLVDFNGLLYNLDMVWSVRTLKYCDFIWEDFFLEDFFREDFFREDFFREYFFQGDFFQEDFFREDFFREDFFREDFFKADFF